jgi:hypothetical protein
MIAGLVFAHFFAALAIFCSNSDGTEGREEVVLRRADQVLCHVPFGGGCLAGGYFRTAELSFGWVAQPVWLRAAGTRCLSF